MFLTAFTMASDSAPTSSASLPLTTGAKMSEISTALERCA